MDPAEKLPPLPPRPPDGHKGSFGTLAVVGGCAGSGDQPRMIGAPALAARAAVRAGVGLVRLVMPEPILTAGLTLCPSATGIPIPTPASRGVHAPDELSKAIDRIVRTCDALVTGPGLGTTDDAWALVSHLLAQNTTPIVLDADGLNMLADHAGSGVDLCSPLIVTPHPGEFRRLAEPLRIRSDPTDPAHRPEAADALARALGCVVVLKGASTVVSNGNANWTCERGHVCLATGGTGDVLAGVIGSLLAQRVAPFDAARIGVQAHAIAGEQWAQANNTSGGLLAMELCDLLPAIIEQMRK